MKLSTKVSLLFGMLILVETLASSTALAQKAPPFSNDIMMDNQTYVFFLVNRLEYNLNSEVNPLVWDAQGYVGKDLNKFWFETEREAQTTQSRQLSGDMEFQGLYSRAISAYFDVQAGIRYDIAYNSVQTQSRGFAVIGLQGLAPYLFELESNLFVSETGDVSANMEAEYEFPITQRLWGQPRFATRVSVQDAEEWSVGSGFNNVELGFRLRYEIRREFAPYVGISWNRQLGQTADFTRREGGDANILGLVAGVRMWF